MRTIKNWNGRLLGARPRGALIISLTCLGLLSLAALPALEASPQHHEHHGEEHQHHGEEHAGGEYRHHEAHHDFEDAERWAKIFDDPERDAWQKPAHVIDLMKITLGMTVADIGAGTGYFAGPLATAVGETGRVLALDVEESMVEFIADRASREGWNNVEPSRIPFDDPSFEAGSVDRILIVNTWHHIADRADYSALLADGLADGGRVFIVDFTRDSPSGPPVEERLEPHQVMAELEAGGLTAELVEEDLPRQYVVAGRKRQP